MLNPTHNGGHVAAPSGAAEMPLVSVAVVTYNQKDFLIACIESILAQDYPRFEIVIADDGSTDGTQQVLAEYAQRYPGVFTLALSPHNQGITHNSNAALRQCRGDYIAWMGGDDLMLPEKLSKQVAFMQARPECAICYHDLDVFESSTNQTLYLFSQSAPPKEGGAEVLITNQCFNGACSCMVRASCSPKNGFNVLIPFASDWLYWIETVHGGSTINYLDAVLGRYRRHAGNVTGRSLSVAQNDIDHLNTCNFLIALDRRYFSLAMVAYSSRLLNLRKKVPYAQAVFASLRVAPSFKGIACALAYTFSLGFYQP